MRSYLIVVRTAIIVAVFAVACRGRTPSGPTDPLDGTWTGTMLHDAAGSGSATLRLEQSGAAVSGTWSADFDETRFDVSGSVGGSMSGTMALLFLTPDVPAPCGGTTLSGTLTLNASIHGDRLTGSFVLFTCAGAEGGSVDLARSD